MYLLNFLNILQLIKKIVYRYVISLLKRRCLSVGAAIVGKVIMMMSVNLNHRRARYAEVFPHQLRLSGTFTIFLSNLILLVKKTLFRLQRHREN